MRKSAMLLGWTIAIFCIANAAVWYALSKEDRRGTVVVRIEKDGASIVQTPHKQILIDGGADDSIERELGTALLFYDRSLDLVVSTAQTPERASGLTGVLQRYGVGRLLRSAASSNAPQVAALTGAVSQAQQGGMRLMIGKRGDVMDLGDGIHLQLFFPDRDASRMPPKDGCLMMALTFGTTAFFFACGSSAIQNYVAMLDGNKLHADVLVGFAGGSALFLGSVHPSILVTCGTSTSSIKFSSQTIDCDSDPVLRSDGKTVTPQY